MRKHHTFSPVRHQSSRRLRHRCAGRTGKRDHRDRSSSGVPASYFFASYPQRRLDGNFVLRNSIHSRPGDRRDEYTGRERDTIGPKRKSVATCASQWEQRRAMRASCSLSVERIRRIEEDMRELVAVTHATVVSSRVVVIIEADRVLARYGRRASVHSEPPDCPTIQA
jgi:hypothetical protein